LPLISGDNGGQTRRDEREKIFRSLIMDGSKYSPSQVAVENNGTDEERPYPRKEIWPSGRPYAKEIVTSKYCCDDSNDDLESIQVC
jgi:hypothetical protein